MYVVVLVEEATDGIGRKTCENGICAGEEHDPFGGNIVRHNLTRLDGAKHIRKLIASWHRRDSSVPGS